MVCPVCGEWGKCGDDVRSLRWAHGEENRPVLVLARANLRHIYDSGPYPEKVLIAGQSPVYGYRFKNVYVIGAALFTERQREWWKIFECRLEPGGRIEVHGAWF